MQRRKPLRRKGGRRFPKRYDADYWQWMREKLVGGVPCDACRIRFAQARAHVIARGNPNGKPDRGNVVLLCGTCHALSEKRADAFMRETGVNLFDKAAAWDRQYQEEQWRRT